MTKEEALKKVEEIFSKSAFLHESNVLELIEEIYNSKTINNWSWVEDEYVALFEKKNRKKGGKVKESIIRMKKFFADNPHIRKEQVLEATKFYLKNTDAGYIRFPHYFIKKGVGNNAIYELEDWIIKYNNTIAIKGNHTSNKLQ